jgi:2'-5' RNA ligase
LNTQANLEKTAVVAIPTMNNKDWDFLQSLRKKYDTKGYAFIEPHFTLLTNNNQFSKQILNKHLHDNFIQQKKIHFALRTAIFMPPLFEHTSWYVFLIPDQGFSELSALHHHICKTGLQLAFYKKFPFIPHITIGSFQQQEDCLQLVETINKNSFALSGCIEKISLIETSNNSAEIFKQILLQD